MMELRPWLTWFTLLTWFNFGRDKVFSGLSMERTTGVDQYHCCAIWPSWYLSGIGNCDYGGGGDSCDYYGGVCGMSSSQRILMDPIGHQAHLFVRGWTGRVRENQNILPNWCTAPFQQTCHLVTNYI